MPGITLAQASAKLDLWLAVQDDIAANGQSTAIHGRTFTAASLADVQRQIEYWDAKVKALSQPSAGRARVYGITPAG